MTYIWIKGHFISKLLFRQMYTYTWQTGLPGSLTNTLCEYSSAAVIFNLSSASLDFQKKNRTFWGQLEQQTNSVKELMRTRDKLAPSSTHTFIGLANDRTVTTYQRKEDRNHKSSAVAEMGDTIKLWRQRRMVIEDTTKHSYARETDKSILQHTH